MNGGAFPRSGQVRLNARRLFGLGSLILQNSKKAALLSLAQTDSKWRNLSGLYGLFLTFEKENIIADAEGEDLTKLSEIVGVACGLAVLQKESKIKLNRFSRFRPKSSAKRADFEFYQGGNRYFHECKGTTYKYSLSTLRTDVHNQKAATKKYCKKKNMGPALTAATGTITVYQHQQRKDSPSRIYLIDPPVKPSTDRPKMHDELLAVLHYYQNYYEVTHIRPKNYDLIGLAAWLKQVISDVQAGHEPPTSPPSDKRLIRKARVSEPNKPGSLYKGTIFDARISQISVRKFSTFEEATRNIIDPVSFIGVSEEVTSIIVECRWADLLEFSDQNSLELSDNSEIFDSGIMVKSIALSAEEERQSQAMFEQQRVRYIQNKK